MSRRFDFERLVKLCRRAHEETRQTVARAIDRSLVARNWLFGRYIVEVEFEQQGADRAEYGSQILKKLSAALKLRIGRGSSVDALERMRRFYAGYKHILADVPAGGNFATPSRISATVHKSQTPSAKSAEPAEIQQTPSVESPEPSLFSAPPSLTKLVARFRLGWRHYVTLLTLDNADVRRLYETEADDDALSGRELKRQLGSAPYEPTALSRDEHEARHLAREGQVVEEASDLIKNPMALEFFGLGEMPAYFEIDLARSPTGISGSCWSSESVSRSRSASSASGSMAVTSSSTRCSTTACCGATC